MADQPTAAELIAELRAGGMTKTQIAAELGRSPRMLTKVERGDTSGAKYVTALRELRATGSIAVPPRRAAVSEQRTRAGRYIQVTKTGQKGLVRGLQRDATRDALGRWQSDRKVSITVTYKTSHGVTRQGTLYAKGGRSIGDILDDIDSVAGEDGDAIWDSIAALIDNDSEYGTGPTGGGSAPGGAGFSDVRTIVGVQVSPA